MNIAKFADIHTDEKSDFQRSLSSISSGTKKKKLMCEQLGSKGPFPIEVDLNWTLNSKASTFISCWILGLIVNPFRFLGWKYAEIYKGVGYMMYSVYRLECREGRDEQTSINLLFPLYKPLTQSL